MKFKNQNEFRERVLNRLHGGKVLKAHHKQALVLEGFAHCLFEKGLADTSFAAVAEYCGMKPSHINYYFATWEKMLETCFRYVIATAQEITVGEVSAATTPEASLKAICDAPYLHLKKFPEHAAVLTAYQMECSRQRKFRSLQRSIREQGRLRIKEILKQIGGAKSPASLETLAFRVQSVIVGYATEWVVGRESESSEKAQKQSWSAVQALISEEMAQ